MEGTSRPAWGCLDAREIREAAAGGTGEPAIRQHLSGCADCRRAVQELRGVLRRPARAGGARFRRSLLARPGLWLFLLVITLFAFAIKVLDPFKAHPPPEPTTAEAPPPVAAPAERPAPRRARPRRTGASAADADIVSVIRSNQSGVRICYERALKRDPRLAVRLNVRLDISAAGAVDRVSLGGVTDADPLAACIRTVIKTWHFPAAPAAYEAAFPLRLQPSPGPL